MGLYAYYEPCQIFVNVILRYHRHLNTSQQTVPNVELHCLSIPLNTVQHLIQMIVQHCTISGRRHVLSIAEPWPDSMTAYARFTCAEVCGFPNYTDSFIQIP